MKMSLTARQRIVIALACFVVAVIGFMVKLPSGFRHIDKELHTAFYFLAAAFLNVLFAKRSFIKHIVIFLALYVFGMAIEYGQAYSNKFFRTRIHGRFDPADVQANLKGLIAFSMLWLIYIIAMLVYNKTIRRASTYNSEM